MIPRDLLGDLIATLEQLRQLLPSDKATWDGDLVARLAVERLWITAGNLAETYRIAAEIESGNDPWAELAGYRNLSRMPSLETSLPIACSPTARADTDRILTQVRSYAT